MPIVVANVWVEILYPVADNIYLTGRSAKMKPAKKIAFCGILTALSFVLLLATGVFPFASYAVPAFCGLLLIPIIIEFGAKQALLVFASVSILSILFAPDRQAAISYIFLLGYYPIVKSYLEKMSIRAVEYLCKATVCIFAEIAVFLLSSVFIGMETVKAMPIYLYIGVGVLIFIFFFIYDWCVTVTAQLYQQKLKPRFFSQFFK